MPHVTVRAQPWQHIMALRSAILARPADVARVTEEGIGLHLAAITEVNRKHFCPTDYQGVLVDQITPGSQADGAGLKPGDVFVQMNDRPAPPPEGLAARLRYRDSAVADVVALLVPAVIRRCVRRDAASSGGTSPDDAVVYAASGDGKLQCSSRQRSRL
jgi:S1-C subfamily serine protease